MVEYGQGDGLKVVGSGVKEKPVVAEAPPAAPPKPKRLSSSKMT